MKETFEKAVSTMDIPLLRKEGTKANARWFLRNGWIKNSEHKNFNTALDAAKKLM